MNEPVIAEQSMNRKAKRTSYKLATKIELAELMIRNGLPASATSDMCKVPRRNLQRWKNQIFELRNARDSKKIPLRKRCNLISNRKRRAKFPQLEEKIHDRILIHRENGLIVNGKWITQVAREEAEKMGIDENAFKASKGWIYRFLKRYDMSLRTSTTVGQKEPDDAREQALQFFHYFSKLRQDYTDYVFTYANMDEVPVWFDMPQSRTYDIEGNRTIKVRTTGNEKQRFTVVLCTLSTGEKVKPMLIFRSQSNFELIDESVYVTGSKGASMTTDLMEKWRKNCWKFRPNYLIDNIDGERSKRKTVLIIDSARCHLSDELRENMKRFNNTDIKIISGGMTKYLQPADIVYNKPFKNHLKDQWNEWMEKGQVELTRTGRRRASSRETVTQWVKNAFEAIPKEMIKSSYHKCGIIDEDASNEYHHRLIELITGQYNDNHLEEERTGISADESETDCE